MHEVDTAPSKSTPPQLLNAMNAPNLIHKSHSGKDLSAIRVTVALEGDDEQQHDDDDSASGSESLHSEPKQRSLPRSHSFLNNVDRLRVVSLSERALLIAKAPLSIDMLHSYMTEMDSFLMRYVDVVHIVTVRQSKTNHEELMRLVQSQSELFMLFKNRMVGLRVCTNCL